MFQFYESLGKNLLHFLSIFTFNKLAMLLLILAVHPNPKSEPRINDVTRSEVQEGWMKKELSSQVILIIIS